MKHSVEKAVAAAAGGVLLASCRYGVSEAGPTMTVTVTHTEEAQRAEPAFSPDEPMSVDVYRLKAEKNEASQTSDVKIKKSLGDAATVLARDTDQHYQMRLGTINDVYLQPSGVQKKTGRACYTMSDIYSATSPSHDNDNDKRLIHIVANEVDACRDDAHKTDAVNSGVAAFAWDNMSFYSLKSNPKVNGNYYEPNAILHEVGHNMGLGHFPEYECEDEPSSSNLIVADNPVLRDIEEIINDPTCGPALSDDGNTDEYSNLSSIMGGNMLSESDIVTPIVPSFSNVDRISIMSEKYKTKTIDTLPATYRLEYGQDKLNGLEIPLSKNHPLNAIDPAITKLVIATEVTGDSMKKENGIGTLQRDCDQSAICDVAFVATSDDYATRYSLPRTNFYISIRGDGLESDRVGYMDSTMNFGVVVHKKFDAAPVVEIVDYKNILDKADRQQQAFEKYVDDTNEELKRSSGASEHQKAFTE